MLDVRKRGACALRARALVAHKRAGKGILAALLTAALAFGLVGCASSGGSSTQGKAGVDTNLASMSWEEILNEAKGQTVNFLAWGSGGADVYVQRNWEQLKTYVKSEYDIDLQLSEFTSADYQKVLTDAENGAEPTYDLFWYTGTMFEPIREAGGVWETKWVDSLPNAKYLNQSNPYVTFDGALPTDGIESPFQGCNPSEVYSLDEWSANLAWNETSGNQKGLFHNFSELAQWVKLYPGKFTYIDLSAAGGFHGQLFVKAIMAELTDNGNGGWKPVYDEGDDAATRQSKVQANIDQWYEWSISPEANEQAFYEKAGYVWAYLNELKANLAKNDAGGVYYGDTASDITSRVTAGDLAVAFTTCTSIASRVADNPDNYMSSPAIHMLDTSVGYWNYSIIMKNSKAKAAAMVVCNAMLDPEQQMLAFETNGNGYNVDLSTLSSDQQAQFNEVIADMGTLSPTSEEVATQSYADKFGKVTTWIVSGWEQYVKNAA